MRKPASKFEAPAGFACDARDELAAFDHLEVVEAEPVAGRGDEAAVGRVMRP
jgi:hypothetical protein